jgi:hypothetical protein
MSFHLTRMLEMTKSNDGDIGAFHLCFYLLFSLMAVHRTASPFKPPRFTLSSPNLPLPSPLVQGPSMTFSVANKAPPCVLSIECWFGPHMHWYYPHRVMNRPATSLLITGKYHMRCSGCWSLWQPSFSCIRNVDPCTAQWSSLMGGLVSDWDWGLLQYGLIHSFVVIISCP